MRCLSIKQPWAAAIVHGPKRIENRSWYTGYRGPIAIHTGRGTDMMEPSIMSYISARWPGMPHSSSQIFAFGAFVGTATLAACVKSVEAVRLHPDQIPWIDDGYWCFVLADVVTLPRPIPWRGMQGLWCEPSLGKIIKEQRPC